MMLAPAYRGSAVGVQPLPGRSGLRAVVLEQMRLEPLERDRLQKPRGNDPVGVDVVAAAAAAPCLACPEGVQRSRASSAGDHSRTSTTSPATAAAATIAGLISRVRPVGLPCRPLKFRLDEDAQTSRPSSRSGFIARHIEQPAPRHSNPASRNTRSSPSRSAAARTACDPGTTSALTCRATRCPRTIRAASRRSDSRRVRAGADERHVDLRALAWAGPARNPMNVERLGSRASARAARSPTPTDWPGLIPHVTVGWIARRVERHLVVIGAPGSEAMRLPPLHRALEVVALRRERPPLR